MKLSFFEHGQAYVWAPNKICKLFVNFLSTAQISANIYSKKEPCGPFCLLCEHRCASINKYVHYYHIYLADFFRRLCIFWFYGSQCRSIRIIVVFSSDIYAAANPIIKQTRIFSVPKTKKWLLYFIFAAEMPVCIGWKQKRCSFWFQFLYLKSAFCFAGFPAELKTRTQRFLCAQCNN